MTDPTLQLYLPAFMVVATCLIIFWNQFRKFKPFTVTTGTKEKIFQYNRMKRVSLIFWIIFSIFGIMTIIYSVVPDLYFVFLPLDKFHHPSINLMGLLIMLLAIVWIFIAQINIDKELYKFSRDIESLSAMELLHYSERMLLSGMLVLFIGFFTTITNIIGLLLIAFGAVTYISMFVTKSRHEQY